jgi:exodeoxyribonuclease VII small subunit
MAKSAKAPASFEQALAELESIVQAMESDKLSLEASLERYQRGVTLLKFCQDTLNGAEQRVRMLEGDTLKPIGELPGAGQ